MKQILNNECTSMCDKLSRYSKLSSIDNSFFETSNLEFFDNMLFRFPSLTTINIRNFKSMNIKYMRTILFECVISLMVYNRNPSLFLIFIFFVIAIIIFPSLVLYILTYESCFI